MTATRKNRSFFDSDKYLISEQPGLKILFTGFLVALIFGLFLRALMNPLRIRQLIEEAGSHIHRDVKVSIGSAEISLAEGWIPRFSVLVKGVRMESDNPCWMSPEVLVDEIELPISIWSLVKSNSPFHKIYLGTVDVRLFGEYMTCTGSVSQAPIKKQGEKNLTKSEKDRSAGKPLDLDNSSPLVDPSSQKVLIPLVPSSSVNSTQNLSEVTINNLVIEHKKYPNFPPLELRKFEIRALNAEKRHFILEARMGFFRDQHLGEFQSEAQVSLEYQEIPETMLQLHFFGNWREGYYSLLARSQLGLGEFDMEGDLKQIPLSQILSVLKYWGLPTSQDIGSQQIWLSSHFRTGGKFTEIKQLPLQINDLHLEGDIGDLIIEKNTIRSFSPLQLDPVHIVVNKLDLDTAMNIYQNQTSVRPPFIGKFGVFRGAIEINDAEEYTLAGSLNNAEFIFSNKSKRVMQQVNSANLDATITPDQVKFNISNFNIENGKLDGFVNFSGDRAFQNFESLLHVKNLELDSNVQDLMTGNGNIGPMDFEIKSRVVNSKIRDLKGKLSLSEIEVEGILLDRFRSVLDYQKDSIVLNVEMQNLKIRESSPAFPLLTSIVGQNGKLENEENSESNQKEIEFGLEFNRPMGQLRWGENKILIWKNFNASYGRGRFKINLDGGWNENGDLYGGIITKSGKSKSEWKLLGTRTQPIIIRNNKE